MGFFRYSNTISFFNDLNISPDNLKGQIEEKTYFLEWGSNPLKNYFGTIYLQGRNIKIFSFVFGANENSKKSFQN